VIYPSNEIDSPANANHRSSTRQRLVRSVYTRTVVCGRGSTCPVYRQLGLAASQAPVAGAAAQERKYRRHAVPCRAVGDDAALRDRSKAMHCAMQQATLLRRE